MAALLLVAVVCVAVPARAQPPLVTIDSVTFTGSGCNWGNTNYVLSNDYKVLTVMFGGMIATTDSGLAGKRKNCQISLGLKYPDGFSFTLGKVTGRGFADIGNSSTGTYQTSYYISGQTGTSYATRTIQGKFTGNYEFTDILPRIIWSNCNNAPNLNINSEVRVDGKKAVMTLDSSDQKFKLLFSIDWLAC
ncbi:hypothetical protein CBR_g68672 [Chara braunii]|uniref:NADH:ubiquinone oxidoreductase intermediate-associated protein 30 domain-containing protein n=1 Tax=Chara braunii TaxID=69332 RepID=A0A388K9F6_CHABU|nr:hypothetical protein CBR_g68672 [Chara braunii]|eukprot:GBG66688.1 hypothetical protein CBR_g68672 [Chara braunii]